MGAGIFFSFNLNCKNYKGVLHHDAMGYYAYLPHVFIFHSFEVQPNEDLSGFAVSKDKNYIIDKYTYGTAVLILPFFFLAHFISILAGNPPNGFSVIYDMGLMISAVFYLVWGLYLISLVLRRSYKPIPILLAFTAIFFGTNLYFYTIKDPVYSHVYSFFLFCLLIYLVPRFYNNTSWKNTLMLAINFGLVFLIRPTNGVVLLYLLLFDVYTIKDLKKKWDWIKNHLFKLFLICTTGLPLYMVQVLYWHFATGKWQSNGYVGEAFIYWNHPKIIEVLFSVQNGLFIYAPVIFFAISGLIYGIVRRQFSSLAILFILFFATYVFASWWCWWYGGAYGHRGYIEYFAFLIAPLALVFSKIGSLKWAFKYSLSLLAMLFVLYNIKLIYAYSYPWEGTEWTWHSLGEVIIRSF